jgi:CheY-like chemotaxis protein
MIVTTERPPEQKKTRGRVLIVDDEPTICNILARILSNEGHQAQTVSDGKAALTLLHERPYDLLVADLRMSGINGIELYEIVKKQYPQMAGKVIFMTGDTMSQETGEFLSSTGRPYLAKPFTPIEFLEIIDSSLTEN